MTTPPVFFADFLASEALYRLKGAIHVAEAPSPLLDVVVPATRWQELPEGTLAALTVHAPSSRAEGLSKQLPQFETTDVIHINGLLALGREDGLDLDVLGGQFIQAILDTLLEDSTFLQLFGWVMSVSVEKTDATLGKDATEFDSLIFRIELELAGAQTTYVPAATQTPIATADVETTNGNAVVESRFDLPQE